MSARPPITIEQLREAVDQHRQANGGRFPTHQGHCDHLGLAWSTVDTALREGYRGLPGGSTLRKWIDETYPAERYAPPYTSANIRAWVVAHREAHEGSFPTVESGPIAGVNRTWMDVNDSMRKKQLPFTRCLSLSTWLDDQFPLDRTKKAARITAGMILVLVEAFRAERDGDFPYRDSGKVAGLNMTWTQLDNAMCQAGQSLARWLKKKYPDYVELTESRLRSWVEDFADQNERLLPSQKSGEIPGTGWSWVQVDRAFRENALPWATQQGLSAWLDDAYPTERMLTPESVRAWVADYVDQFGWYPSKDSAVPVAEQSGWTWPRINSAMVAGSFGWTEKMTLRAWLDREYPTNRALTPENLRNWVSEYAAEHGAYPTRASLGAASPRGYWDWCEIDNALVRQSAGWKGRTSLNAWIQSHMAPAARPAEERDDDIELKEELAPA